MNTTTTTDVTASRPADDNHMSSVRGMLIEQMRALRSASPSQLAIEADRARSIALVAQAITSAARVEVEYVRSCTDTDQKVAFLQSDATAPAPAPTPAVSYPFPGQLVHRIQG